MFFYTQFSARVPKSRVTEPYTMASNIGGSTVWNLFLVFFYVLLTVHLSIILVINQLNAQFLVL